MCDECEIMVKSMWDQYETNVNNFDVYHVEIIVEHMWDQCMTSGNPIWMQCEINAHQCETNVRPT